MELACVPSMIDHRRVRLLFVAVLSTAVGTIVAVTGWLVVRPMAQEYLAARRLVEALEERDPDRVEMCMKDALRRREFGFTVSALIRAMQTGDDFSRAWAPYYAGDFGNDAKPAVPAMLEVMKDSNEHIRRQTIQGLGKMGPAARDAVPHITLALNDPDRTVLNAAMVALGEIGPAAAEAVPRLWELTRSDSPGERIYAAFAIWKIEASESVLPVLIEAIDHKETRWPAVGILCLIGPPAKSAVPAIKAVMADDDPNVRKCAVLALQRVDPEQDPSERNE